MMKRLSRGEVAAANAIAVALLCLALDLGELAAQATCSRTLVADVVALDQNWFWNRYGATEPQGMMYALRRDVVPISGTTLAAGNARLRSDKRPRPLTLRVNEGDCLTINFQNLLNPIRVDLEQPATRTASIHIVGMQLVSGIGDDGTNVGRNPVSGLVGPGQSTTYRFYAEHEGTYLMFSTAATTGGEGDGGSIAAGLFGALNVEPRNAEYYRSQVTRNDMDLATVKRTPAGQPMLNYDAVYPAGHPLAGRPILKMVVNSEIVHSDLTAIITGPGRASRFGTCDNLQSTPVMGDRCASFREFTIVFHDETGAVQAFPEMTDPQMLHTLHSVKDGFAINYASGGAGAEILANRLGVGPPLNCPECKYEEFFLSSWSVGEPGMVVDNPANTRNPNGTLKVGAKATKALYPDDPSNVYHT